MKRTLIVGVLCMGLFNWLTGCASNAGSASISAGEVLQEIKRGEKPYIVDVREPEELKALPALPGAKNIPLSMFTQRYNEIPKDQRVLLVCRSGRRSAQAQSVLKQNGYTQVLNVEGGMSAVQAEKSK